METKDAVSAVFSEFLTDIYRDTKSWVSKFRLRSKLSSESIKKAGAHVLNLGEVHTLWSMERSIHIREFYCAPKLRQGDHETEYLKFSHFKSKKCVIIGPAGQGKSIFLRHLSVREMEEGEFVPIFIELRKLNSEDAKINTTKQFEYLDYAIKNVLEIMWLPYDDESLEIVLASGKFVLVLDGFDELTDRLQSRLLTEIEHLSQKYLDLRLLVSSRPDTSVTKSPLLSSHWICDLDRPRTSEIIEKLTADKNQAKAIKDASRHNKFLSPLLSSPLLVTILVIVYKSHGQIPTSLSDFYEELFMVLLRRHDSTKAGFVRPRKTELDDTKFEKAFATLCFISHADTKIEFSEREFIEYVGKALQKSLMREVDASLYTDDIVKITSLVIREGNLCLFAHRTIQEYFAAKYIAGALDKNAEAFYSLLCSQIKQVRAWKQVLVFLEDIDNFRFTKHFLLPSLDATGFFKTEDKDGKSAVNLNNDFFDVLKFEVRVQRRVRKFKKKGEIISSPATYKLLKAEAKYRAAIDGITFYHDQLIQAVNEVISSFFRNEEVQCQLCYKKYGSDESVSMFECTDLKSQLVSLGILHDFVATVRSSREIQKVIGKLVSSKRYVEDYEAQNSLSRELQSI